MYDFKQSGIIYMMDDVSTPEEVNNDWRVMLMVRVNEYIQSHQTLFIPIVWSWNNDQQK